MKFEPRLTAPEVNDPYYTSFSPYWQGNVGMPNCTAYSYGRINELKQVTSYEDALNRTHLSRHNAREWWDENDGYDRGQVPQLGAVAVFEGIARKPTGGTYGHVMVVEQIDGDKITLSGSDAAVDGGGGRYFYVDTLALDELRDSSYHGGLVGFIYACPEFQTEKETMSMEDAEKLVVCDYAQYLGRMPSPGDIEADSNMIVNEGMTTEQYDYSFLVSQEYHDRSGSLAAQDFVTRCYRAFLGRFPESEDALMYYVGRIVDGSARYRDIAWEIYQSEEAKAYRGEA